MDETSVMEKAIEWCSPSLVTTLMFYWRVVVCGRLFQLLTEISPGCLAMALVPGSAGTMGIGHATPCTVHASLHCHYLNKFLLVLRKNFNRKRTNIKDYNTINHCLWILNIQHGTGGRELLSEALCTAQEQGLQHHVSMLSWILDTHRQQTMDLLNCSSISLLSFLKGLKSICYSIMWRILVHVQILGIHLLNDGHTLVHRHLLAGNAHSMCLKSTLSGAWVLLSDEWISS